MISSIIVALIGDKIKNIYLPMFIIGMIVSFVDFLTVPIISLGLPLTVYFLIMQKNKKIYCKRNNKNNCYSFYKLGTRIFTYMGYEMDNCRCTL